MSLGVDGIRVELEGYEFGEAGEGVRGNGPGRGERGGGGGGS